MSNAGKKDEGTKDISAKPQKPTGKSAERLVASQGNFLTADRLAPDRAFPPLRVLGTVQALEKVIELPVVGRGRMGSVSNVVFYVLGSLPKTFDSCAFVSALRHNVVPYVYLLAGPKTKIRGKGFGSGFVCKRSKCSRKMPSSTDLWAAAKSWLRRGVRQEPPAIIIL
ncbi:hypothetical protein C7476_13120 [Phyllobacterium bourgognense]|uniref:Uncharacterized protein n=1 Tax=Phyllobacterium bourgognense TaxID=314236 RepID=A0A368YCW9_9HYPH|nr:hypothetical protein C7476_13120 [Phyllobacterium bourgognense]